MDVVGGHEQLMLAIMAGLVIGKPLGLFVASALAVLLGIAVKPGAYSWPQLAGAGALAGIGFTMSLFIAGQAFPVPADFAAKTAVFAASILSAVIGVALLWSSRRSGDDGGSASRPSVSGARCSPPGFTVADLATFTTIHWVSGDAAPTIPTTGLDRGT